jgi:hypothetical protein
MWWGRLLEYRTFHVSHAPSQRASASTQPGKWNLMEQLDPGSKRYCHRFGRARQPISRSTRFDYGRKALLASACFRRRCGHQLGNSGNWGLPACTTKLFHVEQFELSAYLAGTPESKTRFLELGIACGRCHFQVVRTLRRAASSAPIHRTARPGSLSLGDAHFKSDL